MTALPAAVAHRVTGRQVHVDEPLCLSGAGRRTAVAVQFLRECQSQGLRAHWEIAPEEEPGGGPYDVRKLHHLPPPTRQPEEPGELSAWRTSYAAFPVGMLYHRRGPDFITVMDRRDRPASARFTLDHPDLLAAFALVQEATELGGLNAVQREAVGLLAAERLALVDDGWAVALPPRMRRWPVPCTGI